ncbi:MAG: glycosyltransferase family 39 protein [Planctomycetota bacterium]
MTAGAGSRESGRGAALAALVILAVAAWLRLHDLGRWPLDGDELYSHYDVAALLSDEPWPPGVRSHPVGYFSMAAGVALLGPGEAALRLIPALCGLAAVAALLWLRRDVIPRSTALAAGTLAALSPWLIYHSQEARFYGPLLLCATLATLWALPGPGRRPWLAGLALLAAVLCHPSAVLLAPALLLPALLSAGGLGRAGRLLWPVLIGVAALLLLAGPAQWEVLRAAFTRENLAHYDAPRFLLGLGYNLGLGVGALVLLALPAALRERERSLLWCALLPPLLLLLLALLGVSTHQRYAMAAVPAALLLAGRGWASTAGRPALLGLASALALLVPAPELLAYTQTGDRHDYREAAAYLSEHAAPQDILVADEQWLLQLYLSQRPSFQAPALFEAPLSAKHQRDFLGNVRDCWVLLKSSRLGGDYGSEFTAWVQERFQLVARLGVPPPPLVRHDNTLLVFRRKERVLLPTPAEAPAEAPLSPEVGAEPR